MKRSRRLVAVCGTFFAGAGLCAMAAIGVTSTSVHATEKLSFDAASIKTWDPTVQPKDPVMLVRFSPGRITGRCVNLENLVAYAYNLTRNAPVDGLPPWSRTSCFEKGADRFTVEATMPPDTTEAQSRQMMQTLLAERFKLAVHYQKNTMKYYALTVSRGGPKMAAYAPKVPLKTPTCPSNDPGCHRLASGPTVPLFADMLQLFARLDHPIIDKTGLTGKYDFVLLWASDTAENSSAPSLTTALREQLGLEMKLQTGPVDVLTVDHAERPSGN